MVATAGSVWVLLVTAGAEGPGEIVVQQTRRQTQQRTTRTMPNPAKTKIAIHPLIQAVSCGSSEGCST